MDIITVVTITVNILINKEIDRYIEGVEKGVNTTRERTGKKEVVV
jgi:hypothetical protein